MKTLIIAPSWLGDLIMAQSLFMELKRLEPKNSLTVYAPSYMMPILERMPEVDDKIVNPFAHGEFNLTARWADGRRLRKYAFDKVYVLPNSFKSALPAYFAGIKERIGFIGESRYLILNKIRKDKKAFPRMVERYVALAHLESKSAAELPSFAYPKLELKVPSAELLTRIKLKTDRPLLALGCGANYGPSKLWPPEYFAKVCTVWVKELGGAVLAAGTKKDQETVNKIKGFLDEDTLAYFYDAAGLTDLTEALDLIGICRMAVCNDSGMMHTVAAAGVPQVCIFGSTSTQYTPPLSSKAICLESNEPCHPCFERTCRYRTYACLKKLTPDLVIAKIRELI